MILKIFSVKNLFQVEATQRCDLMIPIVKSSINVTPVVNPGPQEKVAVLKV